MLYQNYICVNCSTKFDTNLFNQKRCPKCIDVRKGHTSSVITVKRTCMQSFIVKNSLPQEMFKPWTTGEHKDVPSYRAIFSGKELGEVDWEGRVDVWITNPQAGNGKAEMGVLPTFPNIARMRVMEVEKEGKIPVLPKEERGETETILYPETWQYLALDPLDTLPIPPDIDGELIWITARSKYTLKGLGRQYSERVDFSKAIWYFSCLASCRSGRINCQGVLAIVNVTHPIISTHNEDGHTEIATYPPEADISNLGDESQDNLVPV